MELDAGLAGGARGAAAGLWRRRHGGTPSPGDQRRARIERAVLPPVGLCERVARGNAPGGLGTRDPALWRAGRNHAPRCTGGLALQRAHELRAERDRVACVRAGRRIAPLARDRGGAIRAAAARQARVRPRGRRLPVPDLRPDRDGGPALRRDRLADGAGRHERVPGARRSACLQPVRARQRGNPAQPQRDGGARGGGDVARGDRLPADDGPSRHARGLAIRHQRVGAIRQSRASRLTA